MRLFLPLLRTLVAPTYNCTMTKLPEKTLPAKNNNLQDLKIFRGNGKTPTPVTHAKTAMVNNTAEITPQAKNLNADTANTLGDTEAATPASSTSEVLSKAKSVASTLATAPVLPVVLPKETKKLVETITDKKEDNLRFIKKPAVIFIQGFSPFGISNGDGISEMADNFPGAKKFSWEQHDDIMAEIKKHAPDQPVVLVGHSFGGDTAVEIAEEFNSAKNGFRSVDLLVSIDAVGMNKTIMPINVKSNLNFFGEGILPFVHGDPNIARNTKYTEVTNELRADWHSKMDDNPEVQFQIFEKINQILKNNSKEAGFPEGDIFIEITEQNQIKDIIEALKGNQGSRAKA
jgi:hypothetical protein